MNRHIQKNITIYIFSAEIALALCGCVSDAGISPTSTMPDIDKLSAGQHIQLATTDNSNTSSSVTWWKYWGDPQLNDLLQVALHEAPSVAIAAARFRHAQALVDSSKADDRPGITGSAQLEGDRFPDHYLYPSPYAGSGGSTGSLMVNVNYHLDFWGKRRQAQDAASAHLSASQAEVADATLLLETSVLESYIDLDLLYQTRDLGAQALEERLQIMSLLTVRQKAGLSTDIDAIQVQESIATTRAEIARIDGAIVQRKNRIAALLGQDPGYAEGIRRPAMQAIGNPAPLSAIPATLLGYRPDIAVRRAEVEEAAHKIGVAKAAFYPDVDLTGFAGLVSLDVGDLLRAGSTSLGAGPVVTLPIFDGGQLRSALKGRTADYDMAVANYRAAIASALQQVADGVAVLNAEQLRRTEAETSELHWRHVVALQQARVHQGFSTDLDLLAARIQLLITQRQVAEARERVAMQQVVLIGALGGAWSPSSRS